NVTFAAPASDNCAGVTYACLPASGSAFPNGTTFVTCTASHPRSNLFPYTTLFRSNDHELPTISCPANIVVSTAPGTCASNVTFSATSSDNCPGVTHACLPASGSSFDKGTTTVTCTATDASGNTNACAFTVTVNDHENPVIGSCPANITTNTASGQCTRTVNFATPNATDNCPGVTVACSPASGTAFAKGVTTVNCT